jgi:hypothetical protein
VRVEGGLQRDANGGTEVGDGEHKQCQLLTTVKAATKHLLGRECFKNSEAYEQ